VTRDNEVVFRDRFHWQGPWDPTTAAWHFGDAPACGSVFATGPPIGSAADGDVVFPTAAGDHCRRFLGDTESITPGTVRAALHAGARLADPTADAPWLLGTGDLAPNHWFGS
jgi:urease accessory protein